MLCDVQLKVSSNILVPNVTSNDFQFQLRGEKFLQWTWQKTQAFGFQTKSKDEADNMADILKRAQAGEFLKKFVSISTFYSKICNFDCLGTQLRI